VPIIHNARNPDEYRHEQRDECTQIHEVGLQPPEARLWKHSGTTTEEEGKVGREYHRGGRMTTDKRHATAVQEARIGDSALHVTEHDAGAVGSRRELAVTETSGAKVRPQAPRVQFDALSRHGAPCERRDETKHVIQSREERLSLQVHKKLVQCDDGRQDNESNQKQYKVWQRLVSERVPMIRVVDEKRPHSWSREPEAYTDSQCCQRQRKSAES